MPKSREGLSFTLMKNCAVALFGSLVRAIAIEPRRLRRPWRASFRMGGEVGFSFSSAVIPPPWIMKPGITRWKTVPEKCPARAYFTKLATEIGAFSWSRAIRIRPRLVSSVATGPGGAEGRGEGDPAAWATSKAAVRRIMPGFYRAPGTQSGPAAVDPGPARAV